MLYNIDPRFYTIKAYLHVHFQSIKLVHFRELKNIVGFVNLQT
jgi:hypothetical protein